MTTNRSKPDQYQLRFPPGLRDRLKDEADRRGRSMNAEIIERLEQSLRGWPKVTIPEQLFERVKRARNYQRDEIEQQINKSAIALIEKSLPSSGAMHRDFLGLFYQVLNMVPDEEREGLQERFKGLFDELVAASDDRRKR
jgi:plasmid stability protein